MRARGKFQGRNPAHAPANANWAAAVPAAPRTSEWTPKTRNEIAASPPSMPFMLSRKLTAFMSPTSSTSRTGAVSSGGSPNRGSDPEDRSVLIAAAWPSSLTTGRMPRRSSHSPTSSAMSAPLSSVSASRSTVAGAKSRAAPQPASAHTNTATPPSRAVADRWRLCASGSSSMPVAQAGRTKAGVRIRARTPEIRKAAAWAMTIRSVPRRGSGCGESERAGKPLLLAGVADRDLQQLVESGLGAVPDEAADLREVGHAPAHVLEGAAVDLLVAHELDRRFAPAQGADAVGEIEHRDLLVGADVEHLALGGLLVGEQEHAAHHVAHGGEAAGLLAVAVDQDGLVPQRPRDHARDHHAVGAGLPRPAGVEAAHDHDRNLAVLPVGLGEALVHRLAAGIRPAQLVTRPQHPIVVLGERDAVPLAVDLAAREQDHLLALGARGLEHDLGAADVGGQGAQR